MERRIRKRRRRTVIRNKISLQKHVFQPSKDTACVHRSMCVEPALNYVKICYSFYVRFTRLIFQYFQRLYDDIKVNIFQIRSFKVFIYSCITTKGFARSCLPAKKQKCWQPYCPRGGLEELQIRNHQTDFLYLIFIFVSFQLTHVKQFYLNIPNIPV